MRAKTEAPAALRVVLGDVLAQEAVRRAKEEAADNLQETSDPNSHTDEDEEAK